MGRRTAERTASPGQYRVQKGLCVTLSKYRACRIWGGGPRKEQPPLWTKVYASICVNTEHIAWGGGPRREQPALGNIEFKRFMRYFE
jgi:hypothetical protein